MKNVRYLDQPMPLARQVADALREKIQEPGSDPQSVLVLTPTAGAARRIEQVLLENGAEPPRFARPMQALLPDLPGLASRSEREAAWAAVLQSSGVGLLKPLFDQNFPESTHQRLKAADILCSLCDQLAEAGQSLADIPCTHPAFDDSARWRALERLYQLYLDKLAGWKLDDPNEARLAQIKQPDPAVQHLVIAGIPDLPLAVERLAKQLLQRGASVEILIWQPPGTDGPFDDWGRPDPSAWTDRPIPVDPDQIQIAAESGDEAKRASEIALRESPENNSAIVLADPKLANAFKTELWIRRAKAYDPEGDSLLQTGAAVIAIEWEAFRKSHDLRTLRRLLELPAFAGCMQPENPLTQSEALAACDYLLAGAISATLEQGQAAAAVPLPQDAPGKARQARARARRLLATVRSRLQLSSLELLRQVSTKNPAEENEATRRVLELGETLAQSPAFHKWPDGFAPVFGRALRLERLQRPAAPGEVVLNGWLEAPWLESPALALCGLVEGRLPGSIDGHPFLPDSVRASLGLPDNAARLARDAYLLDCLLRSRPASQVSCSFSKFDAEGNPNRPSRLLLRCNSGELPRRVLQVTAQTATARIRPRRRTQWRWQLPGASLPVLEKISPTQFKDYLACPFRFCLKHVLRLDAFTPAAREMDAAAFGTLLHKALESFGKAAIERGEAMLGMTADEIRTLVLPAYEEAAGEHFGPSPAPAVQVQMANARTRLVAFARVQAEAFADGWQIIDAERKLPADADDALRIGPLPLSGVIDRIDRHAGSGALRVMDYKTFSTAAEPAAKHLGAASAGWLPEAEIRLTGSNRESAKAWIDLQLPLYRRILEHWHGKSPATAYFVLPSDPYETAIRDFHQLDDGANPHAYPAALQCAEAVARNIANGVFWPPRPFRGSWDDPCAPLFVNGTPEDSIHPGTIEQLKGTPC